MNVLMKIACVGAVAIASAQPALAQRVLEIDPETVWEHPHSGIKVPTELGGLPRGRVTEFTPDYLNLGFSFRVDDQPDEISLYIYRNTNGGVPVWFEQARKGIELREIYAGPELVYEIAPYAWPGQEGWVGLRAFYDTPNSDYASSTGVALFSVNGWYVKVRVTSKTRSAADLSLWVDTALREVMLPELTAPQAAPDPISDCAEKLEFKKKAKDATVDGASSIINALLGSVAAEKLADDDEAEQSEPVIWCRDGQLSPMQVAYRANASTDSYLMALGDSGIGVSVAPDSGAALMAGASGGAAKSYSIALITDNQQINFVPQTRLPSFKRVMEIINANRRVSATSTWGEGNKIELSPGAL
ncbi:hypothetical protein [Altererythrobacter sp. GH1-8]|uniref:hypothetical protein n=1 Tax=Altererythrobacter sp. GH1-8 TaxID=3349333 RepID=UPI00374D8B14